MSGEGQFVHIRNEDDTSKKKAVKRTQGGYIGMKRRE